MKVVTVGRNPDNEVVINDNLVSRNHLQIVQDDFGNFRLVDFGSKNGTYVNGQRISGEIRLNASDSVKIGSTVLPWKNYFSVAQMQYSPTPQPAYPLQYPPQPSPPVEEKKKTDWGKIGSTIMKIVSFIMAIAGLIFMIMRFFIN